MKEMQRYGFGAIIFKEHEREGGAFVLYSAHAAQETELLDALRKVEWSAHGGSTCGACGNTKFYGKHAASCSVGNALVAGRKETEDADTNSK
jgi:predicted nucleic-acid-binding Zn-ribbon protein